MTIFFTLCSKNYLAQAITLQHSFKNVHPEIDFILGIVDCLSDEEKKLLDGYFFLEMDQLGVEAFESMKSKYNIVELNTAVKPFYIEYFFKNGYEKVVYLDPDIYVYHAMDVVLENLNAYSFILSPHFSTPIYDQYLMTEQIVLGTGIFNLGFFAIKNDITGNALIQWWQKKLVEECILDLSRGYFVDQKWMNLSVCHFNHYFIEKHPGLNMAHWNLHERTLSIKNGVFWVNEVVPLIFFHFSTYQPDKPTKIANWQNRFSFETRPDIVPLFQQYGEQVLNNHYHYWKPLQPVYGKSLLGKKISMKQRIQNKLIQLIQSI